MLSEKAIKNFKLKWYTFDEIESINKWLKDIEEGNTIPFEDVIEQFCNTNKKVCTK